MGWLSISSGQGLDPEDRGRKELSAGAIACAAGFMIASKKIDT